MPISAQLLCDAFVKHYYEIIDSNPQEVHKLYKDSSTLSRTDESGVLATVTTTNGINEKIVSLNEYERKVEVKSADGVDSHDGGVIIFVTGTVSGLAFAQTFFLARQEKGYFVLNDIFIYIDIGNQLKDDHPSPANSAAEAPIVENKPKPAVIRTAASQTGGSYSIYLSGLPHDLTASELEDECGKFGAISPDGVQVRTRADGFTFGFVAFVHESSVRKALKASPLVIKGNPAFVQVKRGGPYGGGGAGGGYAGTGGGGGRDGYYRNGSLSGRRNDGNRRAYSGGDYYDRGYNKKAGGTLVREEDRRIRQDGRRGVTHNRGSPK